MNSGKNLDSDYVKSYYDKFLSGYDKEYSYYRWQAGPVEKLHYYQTKKTILPFLSRLRGTVLEIGGGDAVWTKEYVKNIERLTFLDISEEMISRAKKTISDFSEKISYLNNDFLKKDFENNSFNHVVSIRNLEYFTDKNSFLLKVKNLLKDNGTFVLVTKSPKYHNNDKAKQKALHTAQIDIKDLIKMIESHGLKVLDVRPAILGKLFRFSFMRFVSNVLHQIFLWFPWKIGTLRFLSHFSESFLIYVKK